MKKRFCLNGEKFYTLEEIGDYYGITRERVRQIEAKALSNLRLILSGGELKGGLSASDASILEYENLKQELYEQDYILVEHDVLQKMKTTCETDDSSNSLKIIPLMLELMGYFKLPNKISGYSGTLLSSWCLSDNFDRKSIENVLKALDKYKSKADAIQVFDLIVKAKREQGEKISKELLHLILKVCPDFEKVNEESIRVRFSSLPSIAEKAFRVLESCQEPTHFNDILREINYRLSEAGVDKMATDRALTGQMIADKRFIPIGKSGYWALKTWDGVSTKSITELMELFFHQKNAPQRIDEIYDYVASKRPGVTRQSIITYLYDKPQFIRTGDGEYSLSSWGGVSVTRKIVSSNIATNKIKDAIEEVFIAEETIKNSDLIKNVVDKAGVSEATARKAIKACREIEVIRKSGKSNLLRCNDIRLTSLSARKPRALLRQKVQEAVTKVMDGRQGKRIQKIKLYEEVLKSVDCIRPTFYAYLSEMTDIRQYCLDNKYYCEVAQEQSSQSGIPYLDLSPLDECPDSETASNVVKATDKLNERDVDIGLFELGRIFENTLKRYLEQAKGNGVFNVTAKDLGRLASMISCIERNKEVIQIKFKPHHLTLLREDRNLRAHGNMPSEQDRLVILAKSPFIVEMYIDYIVKFSKQLAQV